MRLYLGEAWGAWFYLGGVWEGVSCVEGHESCLKGGGGVLFVAIISTLWPQNSDPLCVIAFS